MGAQAIHYMNVYGETEAEAYNSYLQLMGIPNVDYKKIDKIIENYDSHANDEQVEAFIKFLKKNKIDVDNFQLPGEVSQLAA